MLESTLTRFLAVSQFYHFAFLVVSLALLGFGASGTMLSIFPRWFRNGDPQGEDKLGRLFAISGVGFALSVAIAYIVINWLPFDSYSIVWDRKQVLYLSLYYLAMSIPFVFAGIGIGAALAGGSNQSNLIYAVNLLGSACGIVMSLVVMHFAGVPGALLACALIALIAVVGYQHEHSKWIKGVLWAFMIPGLLCLIYLTWFNLGFTGRLGVTISPYKGLPYAVQIPGSERLFGAWNAFSRLDVMAGASTRVMPGLSYTYPGNPPNQIGLSKDGDNLQPITLIEPENFKAGGYLPEAVAFELHPGGSVLVVEPGGGLGVLQALSGGADRVVAIVSNPLQLEAVSASAPEFDIYRDTRVATAINSPRAFLESSGDQFDLIFLPLTSPYRPIASGAFSLTETYNLTEESLSAMLSQLTGDGLLVVTRWLQTPPSESLRILSTIISALEDSGAENIANNIAAYRGVQTMTFLVKPDGWKPDELIRLREFLDERRFDLVWALDVSEEEVNHFNKLPEPEYYNAAKKMITGPNREAFITDYSFDIRPVVDDRPFFFHFFKTEQTPQVMATLGRIWQPFGGSGYFVLVALLTLVTGFSVVLILIPLLFSFKRRSVNLEADGAMFNWRVLTYFGSIGLAFLFIEIPLIQMAILIMEQPVYAFALVVVILLLSSSVGSLMSRKQWVPRKYSLVLLFVLAVITPLFVRSIQDFLLGWPVVLRMLLYGSSLIPLGIAMGLPFPFGLQWLEKSRQYLVPWAWGVNGCASVIASVLAALLALNYGFSIVLLLGAGFYGLAALTLKA